VREMEGKVRAMMKKAKKPEKKKVEEETKAMLNEVKERHERELASMKEANVGVAPEGDGEKEVDEMVEQGEEAIDKEMDVVARKRAKAQRARDRKKEKEAQAEREREEIRANAGPSMRETELDVLNDVLGAEKLVVKEVASDGNCMYRSIADQLVFTEADTKHSFSKLRELAAMQLRNHPDEYAPFLMLEAGSDEFAAYCDTVQNTNEWGGQVELRALASALKKQLWIYDAQAPVVKMGDEFDGPPLKLTFHRHYYSLGDHYNSVTILNDAQET